jgi:hypothetical protein
MSEGDEPTSRCILPIMKDDEEEEDDLSMDPSIHSDEYCDSDPDEQVSICERCGALDEHLILWGEDSWVCMDCHCCQECGANIPELVDWGDGMYICIDCCEKRIADQAMSEPVDVSPPDAAEPDETPDADDHDEDVEQSVAGNPVNSDPEATQWGVPLREFGGPTDFGSCG